MKKKKWFTLIEMLIVILIIWILLAVGFSLNRNSIDQLRAKSTSEEISSFFDTTFLQIQASNYENWKPYTWIELILSWGSSEVAYTYQLAASWDEEPQENIQRFYRWGWFTILAITWSNSTWDTPLPSVSIQYVPFNPWCKFNWWEEYRRIFIAAKALGLRTACFEIDRTYCKLRTIKCATDPY
jgi:type II secretory pathway pseudopilin PulG